MTKKECPLKARQKEVLKALRNLGGIASTRAIAEETDLHVNGVSQTLGALAARSLVRQLPGETRGGSVRWEIVPQNM